MNWFSSSGRGYRALLPVLACVVFAAAVAHVRAEVRQVATIRVTDAWVRSTPPGASVGAAYATLHNDSDQTLLISKIASDSSMSVELHDMSMRDGMMRMRHLDSGLSIKPGQTVRLVPGGMHLMLLGLKQPLIAGESVALHFSVSDGHDISIAAPVRQGVR